MVELDGGMCEALALMLEYKVNEIKCYTNLVSFIFFYFVLKFNIFIINQTKITEVIK